MADSLLKAKQTPSKQKTPAQNGKSSAPSTPAAKQVTAGLFMTTACPWTLRMNGGLKLVTLLFVGQNT